MAPTIVCGIDASPQAQAALQVASALAERLRLRLITVHAARGATPGLETGSAAERVCAVARDERAQLVVVGSRGHGPLRAAIRGSVSSAVVRDAPCPVVVVPPEMAGPPLAGQGIVCLIQGDEDRPTVAVAARLSRELELPLTLTRVLLSPALPTEDEFAALASFGGLAPTIDQGVRLRVGDPCDEILTLAASTRAAVLVVGSRGLGRVESVLIGSVSRELVRRATRPIVICRNETPA